VRASSRLQCTAKPACAARLIVATSLAVTAAPALGQVGAVLSAYSDERFRGYSLSDGRPVGILDLSYDDARGFYGALSGSVVASREGLRPLSATVNGGYARRLGSRFTGDAGVIHSQYSHYSGLASGRSYTEIYAGLSGKQVGTRLSASPDYVGTAGWTLHGEINGHFDVTPTLLADGAFGALLPIGGGAYSGSSRLQWDARVGVTQRLGPVSLHAALTSRAKGPDIYAGRTHRRTALVFGVSAAL
jgi:hypothetical protein